MSKPVLNVYLLRKKQFVGGICDTQTTVAEKYFERLESAKFQADWDNKGKKLKWKKPKFTDKNVIRSGDIYDVEYEIETIEVYN